MKNVAGRTVLDIGCGSGLHSFCYHMFGAGKVISFDVDEKSVEATRCLRQKAGEPANWTVSHGSILDDGFLQTLEPCDIVYSWGVLHHTGAMWEAVDRACGLVKPGGLLWIALYVKGPKYRKHLRQKRRYNRASQLGKKSAVGRYIAWIIWHRLRKFGRKRSILLLLRGRFRELREPFLWNSKKARGMDTYHDIIDWLGGLPYEVASKEEVVQRCAGHDLELLRVEEVCEGANNIYLFRKTGGWRNLSRRPQRTQRV